MSEQCKREKCKGFGKCNPDLNGWLKNKDLHLAACESQKSFDKLVAWIKQNPVCVKKAIFASASTLTAFMIIPACMNMLKSGLKLIEKSGFLTDSQMLLLIGVGSIVFGFMGLYALAKCFVIISRIIFKSNTKNEVVTND